MWERFERAATILAVAAAGIAIAFCIYFEATIGL